MATKILIADDAAFIREILAQLLIAEGFEIIGEAENGEEAVRLTLELRPEVVIMDLVMPIKSGIQATREILAKLPLTKIVALSTEGSENLILNAMDAGCSDFLTKPFVTKELVKRIQKFCT